MLRQEFRDFDELAETVQGWGLDWVQLDRGPLDAAVQQVVTSTAQLSRFRFSRTFHQRGTTPPGVRTFGFIGERSPDVEWRGNSGTSAHIIAFPANELFEVVSRPGFHGDTVSIPEDRVRAVAESMGLPDPLEEIPKGLSFVKVDRRRQEALRTAVSKLHMTAASDAGRQPNARMIFEMDLDIVSALAAALQSSRSIDLKAPEPALRSRAIQRALDYIESHADQPPSVDEICRASGVSWRTLDYAFRDKFGVTPKRYLQALRLHRVRREILGAGGTRPIWEVAAHWGFWHMGQFAKDYRRQFGELPSETVKRVAVPG